MSKRINKTGNEHIITDTTIVDTPSKRKKVLKKTGSTAGNRRIQSKTRIKKAKRHAWGVEQRRYDKEKKQITEWSPDNVILYGKYRGKRLDELPLDYLAILIRFGAKEGILRKGALAEFQRRGYTEEEILEDIMRFNKQVFRKKEKNWNGIRFFKSKEQRQAEENQSGGVRDLEEGETQPLFDEKK